jgi:hypothetical protein
MTPTPKGWSAPPGVLPGAGSSAQHVSLPKDESVTRPTFWERLGQSLMFWKRQPDIVACSLISPDHFLPGESAVMQVVLHHENRIAQAKALPDWRGTLTLTRPIHSGTTVTLHVSFLEATVTKSEQSVTWAGLSIATIFNFRVPDSAQSGSPAKGALAVTIDQQPAGKLEFCLTVGAAQNSMRD